MESWTKQEINSHWENKSDIDPNNYSCYFCGNIVGSDKGFYTHRYYEPCWAIYICPFCNKPTFFDDSRKQFPSPRFGNDISDIPEDVLSLYNEARDCIASNANTACILCCRKLLMNIAVTEGADEGKHFIEYVDYLASNGFLPPKGRGWVDHIRKKGNEATHEISIMSRDDAEELMKFIEMLLKFIYEFPACLNEQ